MTVLYAYAAPIEAGPLPAELDSLSFLALGVGKAASAHSMTRRLATDRPELVVLFGVCGAHTSSVNSLEVGDLCVVTEDGFADEGVAAEDGFLTLEELGLSTRSSFAMDPGASEIVAGLLDAPSVRGSTVSSCSGNDALATERANRTETQIETMEGAAVALACQQMGVPLVQVRCVSNRTGDRARAGWDLSSACARIQDAIRRVASALATPGDGR